MSRPVVYRENNKRLYTCRVIKARVVVVLWTKDALKSIWVKGEATHALSRDIYVPAQLEPLALPVPFNTVHAADLSHWNGERGDTSLRHLAHVVAQRVGPRSGDSHSRSNAEIRQVLNEPSIEVEYWRAVSTRATPSIPEYQSYLDRFGEDGVFAELAKLRIGELRDHFDSLEDGVDTMLYSPDRPVERVSWDDVQVFLKRLNELKPGLQARLPTEAQWEYAARAGTETPFWWGSTLSTEQANYNGNRPYNQGAKDQYRKETVPVKQFEPNPWGLYQVHGNVYEWCHDWYGEYGSGSATDPSGPETGEFRVCRGGGWYYRGSLLRSAYRSDYPPGNRFDNLGFRLSAGQ